MTYYAGIDVSLEESSICVVDGNGKIIREAKVASDPESLAVYFRKIGLAISRIGLEAGSLSQWLHDCLLYTSPSPRDVEESRMPSSA